MSDQAEPEVGCYVCGDPIPRAQREANPDTQICDDCAFDLERACFPVHGG